MFPEERYPEKKKKYEKGIDRLLDVFEYNEKTFYSAKKA